MIAGQDDTASDGVSAGCDSTDSDGVSTGCDEPESDNMSSAGCDDEDSVRVNTGCDEADSASRGHDADSDGVTVDGVTALSGRGEEVNLERAERLDAIQGIPVLGMDTRMHGRILGVVCVEAILPQELDSCAI